MASGETINSYRKSKWPERLSWLLVTPGDALESRLRRRHHAFVEKAAAEGLPRNISLGLRCACPKYRIGTRAKNLELKVNSAEDAAQVDLG